LLEAGARAGGEVGELESEALGGVGVDDDAVEAQGLFDAVGRELDAHHVVLAQPGGHP
jgi:hypothetical protein